MTTALDGASVSTQQVLDLLVGTTMLRRQVAVYKYNRVEWDDETRQSTTVFNDPVTVYAARIQHDYRSARATGNTEVQAGDWMYLFRASDLPDGIDQKDEISDGGDRLAIVGDVQWLLSFGFLVTVRGG